MVELVELQALAYVAQIVGVAGTLTAAFIAVRSYINSNKRSEESKKKEQETRDRELETRQAQMFMNIYQQVTSKDFIAAWNRVFEDNDWKDFGEFKDFWKVKDFHLAFNVVGVFYEGLGVLVREGFLGIRLVALLICGMTLTYWERIKPIVGEARIAFGFSRFLSESEYLYEELIKYLGEHPELQTEAYKSLHRV